MSHFCSDGIALLVMAFVCWCYSRWLWVTEPGRRQREEMAKAMQRTYHHLEWATVETLQSLLSHEVKTYRAAKQRFLEMLVVATLFVLTPYLLIPHLDVSEGVGAFLLAVWFLIPFLVMHCRAVKASRKRVHAVVMRLHTHQERKSIGALIEAMEAGDLATANLARLAIIAILPELKAEDAPLLAHRHRVCLHRALRGSNSELIQAILHALEQVGDPTAIPYVKRLIPCPVWIWDSDRIEEAAQQCLRVLQERAAQRQVRHTLLRPAAASAATEEVLLRPAQAVSSIDSQQLLRAETPITDSQETLRIERVG
jgi:hypothetical protein